MQVIDYAIMEIMGEIPPQILKRFFINEAQQFTNVPVSLDCVIRDKIIMKRLRNLLNITGATEVLIPLNGIPVTQPDPYNYVFRVPKVATNGRSIICPLSVVYYMSQNGSMYSNATNPNSPNMFSTTQTGSSVLLGQSKALKDVNGPIPMVSTAKVSLIGENTILVNDYSGLIINGGVRVLLDYDKEFSNVLPGQMHAFAQMAVLVAKAAIYTEYLIEMGRGELAYGSDLPEFRMFVEQYSNANEQLQEKLPGWRRSVILGDPLRRQRLFRSRMGIAR